MTKDDSSFEIYCPVYAESVIEECMTITKTDQHMGDRIPLSANSSTSSLEWHCRVCLTLHLRSQCFHPTIFHSELELNNSVPQSCFFRLLLISSNKSSPPQKNPCMFDTVLIEYQEDTE
jgi:hypothetical protein